MVDPVSSPSGPDGSAAATEAPLAAQTVARLRAEDPLAERLGAELVAVDGDRVHVRMVVDERHVGGHGLCHGGVLFSLADIVMSYVSNRDGVDALASHAAIEFIAPVRPGEVIDAVGHEPSRRGRGATCDVELRVGGVTVALFRGATRQLR